MKIYVGYDTREDIAYQVCEHSIYSHSDSAEVIPLNQNMDEAIYNAVIDMGILNPNITTTPFWYGLFQDKTAADWDISKEPDGGWVWTDGVKLGSAERPYVNWHAGEPNESGPEDFGQFNLREIGPKVENHSYFPEKCNVTLAKIKNKKYVKVKVWERGVGLTKACGTAACAAAISGAVLKLSNRHVDIEFPEGLLNIEWKMDNNIYMTGKVSRIEKIEVNI